MQDLNAYPLCEKFPKYWIFKSIQAVEIEHVQDFQFYHVALWRTHYNGCHIQVFSFPCYGQLIPNLSVICDQMYGNSLGIYPLPCILYTPSAQQHANVHGLGQGLNRFLLICLFTKRQRISDKMTAMREENPLKRGRLISWSSSSSCTRQILPALVCTCLRYMVHGPAIRHVPCTMYTTWLLINLC